MNIGINGMGRIGRTILREHFARKIQGLEITAINNPGNPENYAHLLKYDSVHGVFPGEVALDGDYLVINGQKIRFFKERDPSKIPWSETDVHFVVDATGRFKDQEALGQHLGETVKKVMMCAPGKDLDATFVYGVNHKAYDAKNHHIISNASCTTNCLAPVAKVLNDKWGITQGLMTTVHAYTSDQQLLDGSHSDMRRARAAAMSIIPTTTGAAKTVGVIIPELAGKLDGMAVRVPTPNVSQVDFTFNLKSQASVEEINQAMKEASEGELKGVLGYTELELVSQDYMGTRESSIFDATLTNKIGNDLYKIVSWYDNEAGFSNRILDMIKYISTQG